MKTGIATEKKLDAFLAHMYTISQKCFDDSKSEWEEIDRKYVSLHGIIIYKAKEDIINSCIDDTKLIDEIGLQISILNQKRSEANDRIKIISDKFTSRANIELNRLEVDIDKEIVSHDYKIYDNISKALDNEYSEYLIGYKE